MTLASRSLTATAKKRRTTAPDDAVLLSMISAGDLSGLGLLFDRYADDVRNFISRLGVPYGDLDDAVQQTFLDVLRAASRFDVTSERGAKPWIFGIAAMIVRRRRRSVTRALTRLSEWAHEQLLDRTVMTPAEEVERSTEADRALHALTTLAPKKRETFVLVVLEGMSCAEAATSLGVPIATIWTRLHYARIELQQVLNMGQL
jgi:RNA polymerase sigma factor (sigma-70 family)